jgi:transposase
MSLYQNFIGIDIGKFSFVVAIHGSKQTTEYEYTAEKITEFMNKFKAELKNSLVVLEATGGYEMELLQTLCMANIVVHRANTRKVKNFIRSYGNTAKTDSLDARALALYGLERHQTLDPYTPASGQQQMLYALVQRRNDLKQILVAEKNRLKAPKAKPIKSSCQAIMNAVNLEIIEMSKQIHEAIQSDKALLARKEMLKTVPGIGDITSENLLALMPELGHMNRRQAASLAGLAPKANDSGKLRKYRRTGHGRDMVKPCLFLAAMAASRSKSTLGAFYEGLINRGKKKMVAQTAVMRKIIVIANARLAELEKAQEPLA